MHILYWNFPCQSSSSKTKVSSELVPTTFLEFFSTLIRAQSRWWLITWLRKLQNVAIPEIFSCPTEYANEPNPALWNAQSRNFTGYRKQCSQELCSFSVPHSISALLIGASCGWVLAAWSLLSLPLAVVAQPVPLIRCLCFMFAAVHNAAKKSCSRL